MPSRLPTPTFLSLERQLRRAREAAARRLRPVPVEELPLRSPAGHPLACRAWRPTSPGPWPGVLLCPGGLDGLNGVEGLSPVLTAPRLAREGFLVVSWSPSGRNGMPGEEDRNGLLHQEECARALELLLAHPGLAPGRVAVVTISFGLVAALGALVERPGLAARVRVFVDWEGPPSRRWFPARHLKYATDEDAWWAPREATARVARLGVPLWRFQSAWDHVHGADHGLGEELVDAALAGGKTDVWFNGRPATERPRRYGPVPVAAQGDELVAWLRVLLGQSAEKPLSAQ